MEHKVIMNLWMVNGDKSLFRQWHQSLITTLGQVEGAHEEFIQLLVRETDLGRELDKVVGDSRIHYGEEFKRVSRDVWNILMDKAENAAYDKIKMVHKGEGVTAYGLWYRWFTDVPGLGLAEQASMLMHPSPPKREEELADHVEIWQEDEEIKGTRRGVSCSPCARSMC